MRAIANIFVLNPVKDKIIAKTDSKIVSHLKHTIHYITIMNVNRCVKYRTEAVTLGVFCKKGVLRNFAKFTGKHLCQSLCFNQVTGLQPY